MTTGLTFLTSTGAQPRMSIMSSMEPWWASCRYKIRRSSELVINLKTAKVLGGTVPPNRACARRRGDRVTDRRMSPKGQTRRYRQRLSTAGLPSAAEELLPGQAVPKWQSPKTGNWRL
jgi:hypothetical protein